MDIRHIATLARLALTDEETARFGAQITHILEHVNQLRQVDVTGVEPTAHANLVTNVLRPDEPHPGLTTRQALSNAPRAANDLFLITKVVE